jgi:hypothetical protein
MNHSGGHCGGFKHQSWFGIFHLALRGRRFSSDEEVVDALQNWLKTQPQKKFFSLTELKKCETLELVR